MFIGNNMNKAFPFTVEINAALEIRYINNICLQNGLPKQTLQQYGFTTAGITTD